MSDEIPSATAPLEPHRKVVPPRVWGPFILVLLVALAAAAMYGFHERRMVQQISSEKGAMMASLDATRGQIATLTSRLNELTAQPTASKPAAPQAGHQGSTTRRVVGHRRPTDDPRWKELQAQLAEQQKQIEANKADLGSTRTDLQGSIARTHDELVVLERKGERNYFEFNLDKNGQFAREGSVGLKLRKANTKHQFADLELMVDDFKLSQKHVNLYQPVVFYAADGKQPVELVINSIGNNRIHGYVSEPKYKPADLEAMAGSSAPGTGAATSNGASTPQSEPRPKLEPPKN
jgi:uncharacterized coiled-coil protein SlyX